MSDTIPNTTPTREDTKRRREWKEPNELDVPEVLKDRLRSQGYGTRWIRITIDGKDDPVNVMNKLREGYEFVSKEEAGESWPDAPSYEHGRHGNLITIGDLALAKLPLEISKDRTRKMNEKTRNLTDAINRQLYENQNMNRVVPITDDSRSKVFRGVRPATLDSED